jgi:glycosyltransferase involved in cell wall biosynthesis
MVSLHVHEDMGSFMLQFVEPQKRARICVGVCTFRRPTMLTACLESLMLQVISNDIEVEIVVVDNEARPNNRGIVNSLRARSPLLIHYVHEPRRGIAAARNRVLDMALHDKCDWIAFIDDDETADPFWLIEMMAPEYREVPVLLGHVDYVYPEPLPFWAVPKTSRPKAEGRRERTATTTNVRFSTKLVRAGLRFNEKLGLMGGEDQEFFSAAHQLGFEICRTQRAQTRETFHRERLSYGAQMYRAYWCAVSDLRRLEIERGRIAAVLRKAYTVPLSIVFGTIEIVSSPLCVIVGIGAFKRRALAGGKKIAKGLGRLAAMVGHLPRPYARVHGN